jgi:hypothetical protein
MAKPNPFAGKKAPPFTKGGGGGGKKGAFEGSARDVEKFPEGSKADMAMDRKQMRAGPPAFKRGGGVKRGR